ncbi:MAG: hypothetical protein JWQ02_1786 [Capsulimonas sp.]|nr:hypothetical protein [Capsulimonas sp.]
MSKRIVLNTTVSDADTAALLREHAEDRSRLLTRLTEFFRNDERIRAFWLWGSFGRGEADDLSDLDLWLAVPHDFVPEMSARLLDYLQKAGVLISALENPRNGPAGGGGYMGCLFAGRRGFLQVDLYWQTMSTLEETPDVSVVLKGLPGASQEMSPVFNRLHQAMPPTIPLSSLEPAPERLALNVTIEEELAFFYLMLSIVAKYLARDPESDMNLLLYPRPAFEEVVNLLEAHDLVGVVDWSIPTDPLGKINRLNHLAVKAEVLIENSNARGIPISQHYATCLKGYLEIVAKIISC